MGCAFAICLEKKQKREREAVQLQLQMHTTATDVRGTGAGAGSATYTTSPLQRVGSARPLSLTERLQDPQAAQPARTPLLLLLICALFSFAHTFSHFTHFHTLFQTLCLRSGLPNVVGFFQSGGLLKIWGVHILFFHSHTLPTEKHIANSFILSAPSHM